MPSLASYVAKSLQHRQVAGLTLYMLYSTDIGDFYRWLTGDINYRHGWRTIALGFFYEVPMRGGKNQ